MGDLELETFKRNDGSARTDCYFNSVWSLGTLFADPLSFY